MEKLKGEEEQVETATQDLTESVEGLTEQQNDLKEEIEKVIDAFDDSLRPADSLARKIDILTSAGRSNEEIIGVMADEIREATAAHVAHGQSIPASVAALDSLVRSARAASGVAGLLAIDIQRAMASTTDFAAAAIDLGNDFGATTRRAHLDGATIGLLSIDIQGATSGTAAWDSASGNLAQTLATHTVPQVNELGDAILTQVSTAITDTARGLAEAVVQWEGFGATGLQIVEQLATGITQTLIEGALSQLSSSLDGILGRLPGLGGISLDWVAAAYRASQAAYLAFPESPRVAAVAFLVVSLALATR